MPTKSSQLSILSRQFAKIHTNHGITQSKAGSKDLRGVKFGYTPERALDKTTLVLRYTAQKDGTIPRETITYQSEEMAIQAHDILKASVNKRDTRKQKQFFENLSKVERAGPPVTKPAAQAEKKIRKLPYDQGLRRFLGADLCP